MQKKCEGDLKIGLCDKRLYFSESVKYLGVKIYINFSCQYHINDLIRQFILNTIFRT